MYSFQKQEDEQFFKKLPLFYATSSLSNKTWWTLEKILKQKDEMCIFIDLFLTEMDSFPPGSAPSTPTNSISLGSLVSGRNLRTVSSFSTPGPSSLMSPPSHAGSQTGRAQLNAASDGSEGTPTSGASSSAGKRALAACMLSVF